MSTRTLQGKGIMTGIHYPLPIHRQPLYQQLGYEQSLPVSEKAACEVLSLPIHPGLTNQDLEAIVEGLRDA